MRVCVYVFEDNRFSVCACVCVRSSSAATGTGEVTEASKQREVKSTRELRDESEGGATSTAWTGESRNVAVVYNPLLHQAHLLILLSPAITSERFTPRFCFTVYVRRSFLTRRRGEIAVGLRCSSATRELKGLVHTLTSVTSRCSSQPSDRSARRLESALTIPLAGDTCVESSGYGVNYSGQRIG